MDTVPHSSVQVLGCIIFFMKNHLFPSSIAPGIPDSRSQMLEAFGSGTTISAKSATLLMSDGRHLIDFASGGFGYCQQAQVAALRKQFDQMCLSSRAFYNETFASFVEKLVSFAPHGLSIAYPCNSGAEAVEGALKLALGFDERRQTIVCTTRAYHGHTLGAQAVSTLRPGASSRSLSPFPVKVTAYGDLAAMKEALAERPAAVILEPVALHDGFEACGATYLQEVRKARDGVWHVRPRLVLHWGRGSSRHFGRRQGAGWRTHVGWCLFCKKAHSRQGLWPSRCGPARRHDGWQSGFLCRGIVGAR
jgi:Aminotransferase class-III